MNEDDGGLVDLRGESGHEAPLEPDFGDFADMIGVGCRDTGGRPDQEECA